MKHMSKRKHILYWFLISFAGTLATIYWVSVSNTTGPLQGADWYGWIGGGIAGNGALIGIIIHYITAIKLHKKHADKSKVD